MYGFKKFLPFAIVITAFCGLIYLAVQQNYRISANDPQIQISEDYANYLSQGGVIKFPPQSIIDFSKSLYAFEMIFDSSKKLVTYSGISKGKIPELPSGVFDYTKKNGQDRFTWQPEKGVRIAAVLTYFKGRNEGYILVGRSLREIEIREDNLLKIVFGVWFATIVVTFLSIYLFDKSK